MGLPCIREVKDAGDLSKICVGEGNTVIVYVDYATPVDQLVWILGQLHALWPTARVAVIPGRCMHIAVIGAKERCDAACCGDEVVQKGIP